MSDLLTRLAMRAVGVGVRVHPLVRPAFGTADPSVFEAAGPAPPEGARGVGARRAWDPLDTHEARHAMTPTPATEPAAAATGARQPEAVVDRASTIARELESAAEDVPSVARLSVSRESTESAVNREAPPSHGHRTDDVVRHDVLAAYDDTDVVPTRSRSANGRSLEWSTAQVDRGIERAASFAVSGDAERRSAPRMSEMSRIADDQLAQDEQALPPHLTTRDATTASPTKSRRADVAPIPASPTAARAPAVPAAQRDEQVVHVTIGRVEIRATVPSAAPAPRPAPVTPRTLTLDDYLAQRTGPAR